MALPFDIDPFGQQVPPAPVPTWAGPVPLPPEWGALDLPPPAPEALAPPEPVPAPVDPALAAPLPPGLEAPPAPTSGGQPGLGGVPLDALDAAAAPSLAPPDAISDAGGGLPPVPPPPQESAGSWFENPLWKADETTLATIFSQDPLALGAEELDIESKRQRLGLDRRSEMIDRDTKLAVENQRIFRESQAATMKELASLKEESARVAAEKTGWASKSGVQKVAGVIAGILGGLLQGKTGSQRNAGLDMINGVIDRELAEHRQKLSDLSARRKDAIDQLGMNANAFRQEELLRQAMYEQSARQVESDMANYDPRGTKFVQLAKFAQQLRTQAAASGQKWSEEDFKRRMEVAKLGLETDKFRLDVRKQDVAERKAALGAAGAAATDKLIQPADAKRIFGIDIERPMKQGEINARLEGLGKAQGLVRDANTTGLSKEQLERSVPGIEMESLGPDGKPVTQPYYAVGAPEEAKKLRNTVTSTKQLVRLLDEVLRIRTGWSSDTVQSDEWKKLQANWASAIGKAKGEGQLALGVLTGPDLDVVGRFLGANDPTQFRDIEAGVLKARENLINDTNDAAEGLAPPGARVKRFNIQRILPEPPKLNADDKAFEAAKAKQTPSPEAIKAYERARISGQSTVQAAEASFDGMKAETRNYVEALGANAIGSDAKAREKALARLTELANGAQSPKVKELAQAKLTAVVTAGVFPGAPEGPPNPGLGRDISTELPR